MKKTGSALYERYTMTHGELLPADRSEDILPLRIVLLTLEAKLSLEEQEDLRMNPFKLPPEAMLSLQYRKEDNTMASYTSKDVLQLNSDTILELRRAMELANKSSRPIVSYVYFSQKIKNPARLTTVYSDKEWQCVFAAGVSYAEVKFIYDLLLKWSSQRKNPT